MLSLTGLTSSTLSASVRRLFPSLSLRLCTPPLLLPSKSPSLIRTRYSTYVPTRQARARATHATREHTQILIRTHSLYTPFLFRLPAELFSEFVRSFPSTTRTACDSIEFSNNYKGPRSWFTTSQNLWTPREKMRNEWLRNLIAIAVFALTVHGKSNERSSISFALFRQVWPDWKVSWNVTSLLKNETDRH